MQSKRFPWFGILLVLAGTALLLDRLNVFSVGWPTLIWLFLGVTGFIMVILGFLREKDGKVFWGTVFFLYGLFFILRHYDFIDYHGHTFVPVSFVIFGLAFVMRVIYAPRDWALLIPGMLFVGAGLVFIFAELGYIYRYDVWEYLRTYWPVIFIVLGISLFFRRS